MVLTALERFEEAETHLSRAIALDPSHTEALYSLAKLRFKQQRYDEMLKLYQQIIDIDPTDALAYGDMGVALFLLGRNDEALRSFDQALSLDPAMKGVRANRDALLERRWKEMSSDFAAGRASLCRAWLASGRPLPTGDAVGWLRLGRPHIRQGRSGAGRIGSVANLVFPQCA